MDKHNRIQNGSCVEIKFLALREFRTQNKDDDMIYHENCFVVSILFIICSTFYRAMHANRSNCD